MRRLVICCTSLLCVLFACEKGVESDFKYVLSPFYAVDTLRFITYDIDNVTYKYYQYDNPSRQYYPSISFPDSISEFFYYERNIRFGRLIDNPNIPFLYGPSFVFKFFNTQLYDKNTIIMAESNLFITNLSEELKVNHDYNIVCPPRKPVLSDSVFMKGVCLNGYTQNVMSAFNFNLTSINEFYSNKSHFIISDIKSVGNGYYLITGDFEAKGIDDKGDVIYLKNGHFEFITK